MKIRLQYFGQLRQLADRETQDIEVPAGTDLLSVLSLVAVGHDERFGKILFTSAGALSPSVMMLANNELIAKGSPPVLRDGDAVALIPAISGG